MGIGRIAVGRNPGHESFQISHDVRVCILTQHERGAGVTDEHVTHAGFDAGCRYDLLHILTQVVGATACRFNSQFLTSDQSVPVAMYGSP